MNISPNRTKKRRKKIDNLSLCWNLLLYKLLHQDDFYDTINSSLKTKLGICHTDIQNMNIGNICHTDIQNMNIQMQNPFNVKSK